MLPASTIASVQIEIALQPLHGVSPSKPIVHVRLDQGFFVGKIINDLARKEFSPYGILLAINNYIAGPMNHHFMFGRISKEKDKIVGRVFGQYSQKENSGFFIMKRYLKKYESLVNTKNVMSTLSEESPHVIIALFLTGLQRKYILVNDSQGILDLRLDYLIYREIAKYEQKPESVVETYDRGSIAPALLTTVATEGR